MAGGRQRTGKGRYGEVGLPVAARYPALRPRRRMLLAGGAVLVVVLGVAAADFFARDQVLLSNGPLSSDHAGLERSCSACHAARGGPLTDAVTDAACSECHERQGDELGVHTFAAHALYRSADLDRLPPSDPAPPCTACHVEHEGREAALTRVPDARCLACHDYGSFSRRHPEFDFAADGADDSGALTFPHVHHVNELMRRRGLAPADAEATCLACHEPRLDGRSYRPIEFDRHCAACHLTATERTPPLPVEGGNGGHAGVGEGAGHETGAGVGVVTLEAIRRRGESGTLWAWSVNPREFLVLHRQVVKGPLHHRDPWVLYNLRRLRHRLYPDGGLADLLTATAGDGTGAPEALYAEAIEQLERRIDGLRPRPEPAVQEELRRLVSLLDRLRRRLDAPDTQLDESVAAFALGPPAAGVDPATADAVRRVAEALTEACRNCHVVEDATIARVQTDQRTLTRAEFDHRPHVVQRGCLDCHDAIPVRDYLGSEEKAEPAVDRAEIHDLPRIAQCRDCHNPRLASERCVACHLYHPDPGRRWAVPFHVGDPPPPATAAGASAAGGSEDQEAADAG